MKSKSVTTDQKIDTLTGHVLSMDTKVQSLDKKIQSLDKKIQRTDKQLKSMDKRQDRMFDDLLDVKNVVKKLAEKFEQMLRNQDQILGLFNNHHEEHIILAGGHREVKEFSARLENLEKIHPQGKHETI